MQELYPERDPPVNVDLGRLLRFVLQKITDGILWVDLEGKVRLASASVQKLAQASPILERRFWDVFTDDYFGFSMREALRYGISHERLYKSIGKREFEISTSFFYEGPKEAHGLLVKFSDIGDRKKWQEIASRIDRMKELGELTARLAHEIRNPLGGIRGFAMLLQRDLAHDPHLLEMASHILEGTKALERLVSTILEYARPLQLALETRDLSPFLKQIARFIKVDPSFPPNIRLGLHIPDRPLLAPFDPDALKRALLNLLRNAVQAMPHGGELTFSLMDIGHLAQIIVSDTGTGMNEEELASLFVPFFTTKKQGNGLGLVETKKIVLAHSGSIDVRSSVGRGSTFSLAIPLRRS